MDTVAYRQPGTRDSRFGYSRLLHGLALATALATFPLIFMGGLVTSHGAGMSVPDWPNSYGYNMFTFPPSKWVGGIFYEHTHRLMGTVVGVLSIAMTVAAWKLESRRWVRWLATGVLGAVIVQGVLGGLRVVWVNLDLAIVHACVAQAFFCLAASVAVITSRRWMQASDESGASPGEHGRRLTALAAACGFAIFVQLILGALMRHEKAGLAIPDLPLAYGQLLPPTTATGLAAINQQRAWNFQLDPVSLGQVWLHMSHRIGACVVSAMLVVLISIALRKFRANRWLLRPTLALIVLLVAQVTLGVLTVLMRKPADIASLHVATGALLLATTVVLTVRAMRCYSRAFRWDRSTAFVETQIGTGLIAA